MNRIWLGAGVAAALLIALVAALASGGNDTPPTTIALPTTTTAAPITITTTTAAPTTTTPTTTAPPTTTTSTVPADEREAEVLALVSKLELRMYAAVYESDVDAIAELVGTQQLYDALVGTNPTEAFAVAPTLARFSVDLYEIKLDRPDCLVVAIAEDGSAFRSDGKAEDVVVVAWPVEAATHGWRIASRFGGGVPETTWLPECDLQNRDWRP